MTWDRAVTDEQKKEITDRLLEAWKKCPAMRLGQLIANGNGHRDTFSTEDVPLVERVEWFAETGSCK